MTRFFDVILITILIGAGFAGAACSKTALEGGSGGGVTGKDGGPTAMISGSVKATGAGTSSGLVSQGSSYYAGAAATTSDDAQACESGVFSVAYVGGGGTRIAQGVVTDGQFTIPMIPLKKEVIITFVCQDASTQRCLGKSGDEGLLCDTVADAVLVAFESALGKSIDDPSFSGKPLSKVAASIVEAAQGDSTAAESFTAATEACKAAADVAACDRDAVNASIFAGSFKLMQSMAQGWSIEAIFNLLTDAVGFHIDVDSFIYSDFASSMDGWLATDFVAQTRAFVAAVVGDQLAGGDAYVIKLECEMHYSKYHAGGTFKYSPVLLDVGGIDRPSCKNDAALALNGLSAGQRTAVYAALDADNHGGEGVQLGTVACDQPNAWESEGYHCVYPPRLAIVSKFKEANRNDPEGKRGSYSRERTISMIDIFPEVDTSLRALLAEPFNATHNCATDVADGPPDLNPSAECQSWFGAWAASQRRNFAGLFGLYLYLKDHEGQSTGLLSLDDIHKVFAGGGFLNSRLAGWSPGYNGRRYSDARRWLSPVLANSGTGTYSFQDVFRYDFTMPAGAAGNALLDAAVAASSLPYADTFAMFENVPTTSEIHDFVFGAAHHEEWNPLGAKFFYGAAVAQTGKPIFCRMTNKTNGMATEKELSENTRIDCLDADRLNEFGVTGEVDADGVIEVPVGFEYPYVLQERGWMGDYRGRIYALADRKSGQMIRPGDKDVLIEQLHAGNPAGECNAVDQAGTVVSAKLRYGWGNETREEAVSAYCMNMSAFTVSNQLGFYWGGSLEISERDSYGNSWKWFVGQIGRVNTAGNPTDISPVCYFAPTGNLSLDSQTKLVSSGAGQGFDAGATIEDDGRIASLGSGAAKGSVGLCSQSFPGTTKYYLVQFGNRSRGESKSDLRGYLIAAEGNNDKLQYQNWNPEVSQWEDLFAYLEADTMEGDLDANNVGSQNLVAPDAPPTYTQSVKLVNQKHDAKFDPYCNDLTGPSGAPNGKCDCFAKGTRTFKDPEQCTLEDDAAEPTLSNAPYWTGGDRTAQFEALFAKFGGKAGEELHYADDARTVEFNGTYLQDNQLWMNYDDVFQCAYKVTGAANHAKPRYVRWDGFWKNHEGCPRADGTLVEFDWNNQENTGGPVRFLNPKPMRNAYDIAMPNTTLKLIGFATKTVGQGVRIEKTAKLFSFDEALALVALRYMLPPSDLRVLRDGAVAREASVGFESVQNGTEGHVKDPASAILRGLTRPEELQ